MLAPRNKLWSTPVEVIEKAINALRITPDDIVYDIGAGDGRFLIRCAQETQAKCIGIEINEDRAKKVEEDILDQGLQETCRIICGNALEQDYSDGTVFYLYLIPRGLRIILPLLKSLGKPIRVITYMSPFPDTETPIEVIKCTSEMHPDAQWPLHLYELNS
mmetsp:Transcript_3941/g.6171  ORF Transcript_3941/g.6171 Transcript_3941/m.6171 type:complete len:161 (-) Transcript_3941:91-573(-)